MVKKELEFNAIKTIKVINKDTLLQTVYSAKVENYQRNEILEKAKTNELNEKQIEGLKDIFDTIILHSDFHTTIYNTMKIKDATPKTYGKIKLLKDIEKQDGKPTAEQTTLLLLADIQRIKNTTTYNCISDYYKQTNKISPEQHQQIIKASKTFIEALEPLLK
jgi:SpoVK/Ycf46/Vps4 family AAA+-type ATPase